MPRYSAQWVLHTVCPESKLEVTTEILGTVCLGRGFLLLKWEDPSLALSPWTEDSLACGSAPVLGAPSTGSQREAMLSYRRGPQRYAVVAADIYKVNLPDLSDGG